MNEDALERSTIRFYDVEANRYAAQTLPVDLGHIYVRFLRSLPAGASILDVGCGAGRDLAAFKQRGFRAVGLEPAARLAAIAGKYSGCEVIVGKVEDLVRPDEFDGVWACASLLHLPRSRLPIALKRIGASLRPQGVMFLSMQHGIGELTAPDGRFCVLYEPEALAIAVGAAGFELIETWETRDFLGERPIRWINVLARVTRDHL